MSRVDIEFAWQQTKRLEAEGIVLPDPELAKRMSELIPERKAGRPRLYGSEAEKKKAYRERRAGRSLADLSDGHKTAPVEQVTDMETRLKTPALTSRLT